MTIVVVVDWNQQPGLLATYRSFYKNQLQPGDAADKEQQRLNDALSGLAASLAGGIQGLVWGVWRRGTSDGLGSPMFVGEKSGVSTSAFFSAIPLSHEVSHII